MKKLFTILLVFGIFCINPYDSFANPFVPASGTISEIYLYEDGSWFVEVYITTSGLGMYVNIESSTDYSTYHTDYEEMEVGFYFFTNEDFEDFEFDPNGDYLIFGGGEGIETEPVVFGNYEGSEIPALHNGCALVNRAYDVYGGSDWTFDGKPTPYYYSDDFMPGNIKLTILDYDQEPMSNMAVLSPSIDTEYFVLGNEQGVYYPLIRCDLDPVSFMVSDLTNTYAEEELFVYPGDTLEHTIQLDVNNYSSLSGYITMYDNSSPMGAKVRMVSANRENGFFEGDVERENGFFNVSVLTGIYQVCAYKEEYSPEFLQEFIPVVGSNDEDFLLAPQSNVIYHHTEDEIISGVLAEGVHYFLDDVIVPENEILDIHENTEVHTVFGSTILVEGQISAQGTDDNGILFSTHCADLVNENYFLFGDDFNRSEFSYCSFENIPQIFTLNSDSVFVENCTFFENKCIGDLTTGSYLDIQHSFIHSSEATKPVITLFDNSSLNIFRSTFDHTGEILISDSANVNIYHSVFMNMDKSLSLKDNCNAVLKNNLFSENEKAVLLLCEYYDNGLGALLNFNITLNNSIFIGNEMAISSDSMAAAFYNGSSNIKYNEFWNNTYDKFNVSLYEIGSVTGVNMNGDSCDNYKNIFLDPQLDDDFHLTFDSPCINAGNPDSPKDPDSTIIDIGPFFYDLSTQIEEYEKGNMTVTGYPNPAKEKICFDLNLENDVSGTAVITLYNLNGVVVAEMYEPISSSQGNVTITMPLANRGINAGLYIYSIIIGGNDAACGKITVVN